MLGKMCRILLIGLLTLSVATLVRADTVTGDGISFMLLPDNPTGNINGAAGSTIGWGYTVTDTSIDETLTLTGFNAGIFQYGSLDPSYFLYDEELTPALTDTWTFDPVLYTGLAAFTIDSNAPLGVIDTGDFTIDYSLCTLTGVCSYDSILVPYSVTVTPAVATPEPSTLVLLCAGLALCFTIRRGLRAA